MPRHPVSRRYACQVQVLPLDVAESFNFQRLPPFLMAGPHSCWLRVLPRASGQVPLAITREQRLPRTGDQLQAKNPPVQTG